MEQKRGKVPGELREFYDFLDKRTMADSRDHITEARNLFCAFSDYLLKLYLEWFKRELSYSDEHIGEHLFAREVKRDQWTTWVKYDLFALRKTVDRVFNDFIQPANPLFMSFDGDCLLGRSAGLPPT